jgi:hypothetical protein
VTPEQALKIEIFNRLLVDAGTNPIDGYTWPESVDVSSIDAAWAALDATETGNCWLREVRDELRRSGTATGLPTQFNRNYESKEVAAQIGGRWIGWTYWHGGGKHGQPSEIEWMSEAYFLDVEEERREVILRTFVRTESKERSKPILVDGG